MPDKSIALLAAHTISTAETAVVTAPWKFDPTVVGNISIQARFLYGSSGTDVTAWVQTSLDNGTSWVDIAAFNFTTAAATKVSGVKRNIARAEIVATDGSLADDTEVDGILGDRLRVKYTTTGTYAGATSLAIHVTPGA